MNKYVWILMLVFGVSNISVAAVIESTFDNDDDGWTVNGGQVNYISNGGNLAGYIEFADQVTGIMVATTPTKFSGNLSSFIGGILKFDLSQIISNNNLPLPSLGTVTISSGLQNFSVDIVPGNLTNTWQSFAIDLSAISWGTDENSWLNTMSNVSSITLAVDSYNGVGDAVGIDNFKISSVPLPASVWLFIFGMVLIVHRQIYTRVREYY